MKTLLLILSALLLATVLLPAQELPPLPPLPDARATEMQNSGRKARVTATVQENRTQRSVAAPIAPVTPASRPYIHPEQQRILDTKARMAKTVTPAAPATRLPARSTSLRSPKQSSALESALRDRRMKPRAESAPRATPEPPSRP